MHCFCQAELKATFAKILDLNFKDIDPEDDKLYCREWFLNYSLQQGMVIGSSMVIVLINIITGMIFEKIVAFEKRSTVAKC